MSILNSTHQPPRWLLFIRIAQAVIAVILLGLTAFAYSNVDYWNGSSYANQYFPCLPFSFFAFVWTVGFLVFAIFFSNRLPITAKPLLIMIILEALTTLWWLVTFALLADSASKVFVLYHDNSYYKRDISQDGAGAVACVKAAAGIGAIEFLLFVASLIVISMEAHRAETGGMKTTHTTPMTTTAPAGDIYAAGPHQESGMNHNPTYDQNAAHVHAQGQYPQQTQYAQQNQHMEQVQQPHQGQYNPAPVAQHGPPQQHY